MRLFQKITAPLKKIVWFDDSAHFVFLEEPSRFVAEMRRVVQETNAVDDAGTVIEHKGDFERAVVIGSFTDCLERFAVLACPVLVVGLLSAGLQ